MRLELINKLISEIPKGKISEIEYGIRTYNPGFEVKLKTKTLEVVQVSGAGAYGSTPRAVTWRGHIEVGEDNLDFSDTEAKVIYEYLKDFYPKWKAFRVKKLEQSIMDEEN